MTDFPGDLRERLPTPGAVEVLRVLLRRAAEARRRLGNPDDVESLHDFRVALRRLRSCLRAYRPYLRGVVPRKTRHQLRAIAADTGSGRDAEVQLAWIRAGTDLVGRGERAGIAWLVAQITARRSAQEGAVGDGARRFDRLARSLRAHLGGRAVSGSAGNGPEKPGTFGAASGTLILEHTVELGARLAAVASVTDEEEAHLARIRAKRLRYLLEPTQHLHPEVPAILARLETLQDLLGNLHDMHVLAAVIAAALERAAVERVRVLRTQVSRGPVVAQRSRRRRVQPGLLALLGRATARQRELFAHLESTWLGAEGDGFLASVEAVGKSFLAAAGPSREIERKFLLKGLPSGLRGASSLEVRQGWLPGTVLQERLRCITADGQAQYYRTVKSGRGIERIEIEEETTPDLFDRLWPLTEGRRVAKRRYRRRDRGLTWEVDVFADRELVLAEVELPATTTPVAFPKWLRESVVREVTDEAEYVNVNLAR